VHFEVVHEFDIPLDALELAVLSPDLAEKIATRLHGPEAVEQREHRLEGTRLRRVWSFRGNVKVPVWAGRSIVRELWAWDERSVYDIRRHASEWTLVPRSRPGWQKYFAGQGSYQIFPLGAGRSRRVVSGRVELRVPLTQSARGFAERLILNEVKKTLQAEADTLREMAELA
jgi:hypothetical protein